MNYEKLPSGKWRVRITINGRRISHTWPYKPKEREAYQILFDKAKTPIQSKYTFREASERYIDSKRNILAPSTIYGYEHIVRQLSDSFLDGVISSISLEDIQAEINLLSAKYSYKTVRNANGFISAVLGFYDCKPNKSPTLPRKQPNAVYVPSQEHVLLVMESLRNTEFYAPYYLACLGLRKSEILALLPSDLNGNLLTINKAIVRNQLKLPKTDASIRTIQIPTELAEYLHKSWFNTKSVKNGLYDAIRRSCKQLGISQFSIHSLRHYFASKMIDEGIPIPYIEQYGGWERGSDALQKHYITRINKMPPIHDMIFSKEKSTS